MTIKNYKLLLQKPAASCQAIKAASRSVVVVSKLKENTPNAPSASKHCVDRGDAIGGGLDLHEEIRLHQTGCGLEKRQ